MASKDPLGRMVVQGRPISWIDTMSGLAANSSVPFSNQRREPGPGSPALQIRAPILHKQYAGCCNEHCNDYRGGHQHNMHDQ
jgi:hypothetical protein